MSQVLKEEACISFLVCPTFIMLPVLQSSPDILPKLLEKMKFPVGNFWSAQRWTSCHFHVSFRSLFKDAKGWHASTVTETQTTELEVISENHINSLTSCPKQSTCCLSFLLCKIWILLIHNICLMEEFKHH
ncbi:uncharacterized protein M6G45_000330 [Spheniscus humboldti]